MAFVQFQDCLLRHFCPCKSAGMLEQAIESLTAIWKNERGLIVASTGVAASLYFLASKIYAVREKSQLRKKWNSAPKDVVILHQLPRGKFTPSISPFPLKLETYLRMAGIRYENDFTEPKSLENKTPWITLNGEDVADSQICLELLADKFQKDFSCHLSPEEKATARAFQIMAEDHFYWTGVLWRWVYTKGKTLRQIHATFAPPLSLKIPLVCRRMKSQAIGQGLGRHAEKDVIEMGIKDLRAMSHYLGNKSYFMGEEPTELDCAMFGMLAQLVWNMPGSPFERLLNSELPNLKRFCERMKDRFWSDWDQCLLPVPL